MLGNQIELQSSAASQNMQFGWHINKAFLKTVLKESVSLYFAKHSFQDSFFYKKNKTLKENGHVAI